MIVLIFRIIEKVLIIYFTGYFLFDILLFIYSIYLFRFKKVTKKHNPDYSMYPVSIIVPAFNEQISIVYCARMLLELDYPNYEIIIINDGSNDETFETLMQNFNFDKKDKKQDPFFNTKPIINVYGTNDNKLVLIDKVNGGKADSINAGINYSNGDYICTIDADSILDEKALKDVVNPFIVKPHTVVSGGQLAASNDMVIEHNKVVSSTIPGNIWVLWQIIEYIKSFMISRTGLSRLNALLIMSGAFSLYKKDDLVKIGGFLTKINDHNYIRETTGEGKQTVCEDMEIVVRMFRYHRDHKLKARTVFLPDPVCWTEVPDNGKNIFRQRSRWHQGLAETLSLHRKMIYEPRYGAVGLLGLPYYFFFELLSPLVKIFAILFLMVSAFLGTINFQWVILLIVSAMLLTAIMMSTITAVIEKWSYNRPEVNREALRYKSLKDWTWLILSGIIGEFSYSFYKIAAQINGIFKFMKGSSEWNKFERKGLQQK